jgi:hypothetical protein
LRDLSSLLIAVIGFTLVLGHDLLSEYRGFKIENIITKPVLIRLLVGGFLFISVLVTGKPSGGEFVYFAF